jgi:hypothetical protein
MVLIDPDVSAVQRIIALQNIPDARIRGLRVRAVDRESATPLKLCS